MFFVSGITGQVGGAAARQLLKEGRAVRTVARDPQKAAEWSKMGVEVRKGDFADAVSIASALEGVEGAYLMLPPQIAPRPGLPEAKAMIASFREALRRSPPPRLVVLSSIGSERSSGVGLITQTHLLEQALGDVPFPTVFLRAGSFLENYTFGLHAAASSGWFDTFLSPTDRAFPMIASEDIGNEVARRLASGWSGHPIVELGSPTSADDLARAMSEVLGRSVKARSIPRERWTAILEAQGMAPGTTGPFEEMEDAFNSGWIRFGVPGTERVAGTITPAQVLEKAWKASPRVD